MNLTSWLLEYCYNTGRLYKQWKRDHNLCHLPKVAFSGAQKLHNRPFLKGVGCIR